MTTGNARRLLAGVVRNGVLWGIAWFVLAFVTILVLRTIGVVVPATIGVLDAVGMAIRVGIVGGVVGGVFAAAIRLFYRGRRLSEISPLRFGLGGAIVAELFMLAFFLIANLASGDGFPALANILDDLVIAAVFGGLAAGGSMWLAQRSERAETERGDPPSLGAGAPPAFRGATDAREREHARRCPDE